MNKHKGSCILKYGRLLVLCTGIFLFCFGLSVKIIKPIITETILEDFDHLEDDSVVFKLWKDPPYKMTAEIFAFSLNNRDEFLNGAKPEIVSVGPYQYTVKRWKTVQSIGNGTVVYENHSNYTFNSTASCPICTPNRKVVVPNAIFQKMVNTDTLGHNAIISIVKPFVKVGVHQLLFGYQDEFLGKICADFYSIICSTLDLPSKIAFMGRYDTTDLYHASTGKLDRGKTIGDIFRWNDESHITTQIWRFPVKVEGTDGGIFKPGITKKDRLRIFMPQLCRSIYLDFYEEIRYKELNAYRFIVPEMLFDWEKTGNEAYCTKKKFFDTVEKCLPKGLLDISQCEQGSPPVAFSLPNFLFAAQSVKESIIGMNNSSIIDDSNIIDVEPRTGMLLRAFKRSQINMAVSRGPKGSKESRLIKIPESFIPIFANYETIEIDEETLDSFLSILVAADRLESLASTTMTFGAAITFFAVIVLYLGVGKISYLMKRCRDESGMKNEDKSGRPAP